MSSDNYYAEFVRGKLEKEADDRRSQANKDCKERLRNFESECILISQNDSEMRDRMHQDELKAIEATTDKSLRDIEKMEAVEREKIRKLEEKLRKEGDLTLEARLKEYEEITAKHTNELEVERLMLEKELDKQGAEIDATQRMIKEERLEELKRTQKAMEEDKKEVMEREEARFEKVLDERLKGSTETRNVAKAVAEKKSEYSDKKVALRSEINIQELAAQAATIQTLLIRNSQYHGTMLNDSVERLQELGVEAEDYFTQCQAVLRNENTAWNERKFQDAKRSFDNLKITCRAISQHLIGMERKLADMPKSEEVDTVVKKSREIKQQIMQATICISDFSGNIMAQQSPCNKEKEEKLQKLMTDICSKINNIERFKNHNRILEQHLTPEVPTTTNANKTIQN